MRSKVVSLIAVVFVISLAAGCASRSRPLQGTMTASRCPPDQPSCNVLAGSPGNQIAAGLSAATIAGGGEVAFPNLVTGDLGTICGGSGNLAGAGASVAGGLRNQASSFRTSVGGGSYNLATAEEATIGGGFQNTASGRQSTVCGGNLNLASAISTSIAGGSGNQATFRFASVGGGTLNLASNVASVVAGGDHNLADGPYSSVGGGVNNQAVEFGANVGGGTGNTASGEYATVPGGFVNLAEGDFSFAAGRLAQVGPEHPGAILFADSSAFVFSSAAADEFAVRATGGVRLVTAIDATGEPIAGVRLEAGSGTWDSLSDRNAKSGFAAVDGRQILERLMAIPISTWNYRSQEASIRHIGPMAQDFYAAFGFGQDERYISSIDADGVALAAIQELNVLLQEKEAQIAALEMRVNTSNFLAIAALGVAGLSFWRRSPKTVRRAASRKKKGFRLTLGQS